MLPLLETRSLSFGYPGHSPVLNDVNIILRRGEMCALLGPNGVGKTTLLRLLLGLLHPSRGDVLLEGIPLYKMTRKERALRMAYVSQEAVPRFPMTVFEAVLLGRKPHMRWGPNKKDFFRTGETLTQLGLEALAQRHLDELSGGQRQKVAIARALTQDADCLLLDEPVSNLDLRHQIEILKLTRDMAENHHVGIFIILHDINMAIRFAHTIVLLKPSSQGAHVEIQGESATVLTPERMRMVYGISMDAYHGESGESSLWFPSIQ